jgi:hypothetical protein
MNLNLWVNLDINRRETRLPQDEFEPVGAIGEAGRDF